ncbi:metal-sensitive transcriptional regulator [Streptomyces sp. SID9913]|uniref:metal-sensitive transcriptional regulator n=1 Tax=Streptomyces sp. SID9913 TaxID=2706117 RepID=UPI0023B30CC1|nr:metal-sensitive transcriptional regulator [Streptomyces sp. SID9913]
MVTDDRSCIDVLTQISAVGRALQEVALGLLDDHVRGCVTTAARAEERYAELTNALRRALRL